MSEKFVIGTDITVQLTLQGVDVSGATTLKIGYIKANGSETSAEYVTATLTDTGTDSTIEGTIPHADNDTLGMLRVFPWVVQGDGKIVSTPAVEVEIISVGAKGE